MVCPRLFEMRAASGAANTVIRPFENQGHRERLFRLIAAATSFQGLLLSEG